MCVESALIVLGHVFGDRHLIAEPFIWPGAALETHRKLIVEGIVARDQPFGAALRRGPVLHIVLLDHAGGAGIAEIIFAQRVLDPFGAFARPERPRPTPGRAA